MVRGRIRLILIFIGFLLLLNISKCDYICRIYSGSCSSISCPSSTIKPWDSNKCCYGFTNCTYFPDWGVSACYYANSEDKPAGCDGCCDCSCTDSGWEVTPNNSKCENGYYCDASCQCQEIACFDDSDCDDGKPCTQDTCKNPGQPSAYCTHTNLGSDHLCNPTFKCSTLGDNGYGAGGNYSCQGYCDGSGNCDYAGNCTNCDNYDGWRNYGDYGPGCSNMDDPTAEYWDYFCSDGVCTYSVTSIKDCDDPYDGWYGGGNIEGCGSDPSSQERDYYVNSAGSCTYTTEYCSTKNCDWSDICSYTCNGSEIRAYKDYYVIPNTSTCTYVWGPIVEDCALKNTYESDGCWDYTTGGYIYDYITCSDGSCTYNTYYDSCSGYNLTEYCASGSSYITGIKDCRDYDVAAFDSDGDDSSINGYCKPGKEGYCSDSNPDYCTNKSAGSLISDYCSGAGKVGAIYKEAIVLDVNGNGVYESCTYKDYDPDTNSNTCGTCALNWQWGCSSGDCASSPNTCCGDDANEYAITCSCNLSACFCSGDTKACCAHSDDCVWNNACYLNGTSSDIDGDGVKEYCNSGKWYAYPAIKFVEVDYDEIDRDKETSGTTDKVRVSVEVYDQNNWDMEGVYITIYEPDGTTIAKDQNGNPVNSVQMTCSYLDANNWSCYHDYNPKDDAELGYYDVVIVAKDKEGLTDSVTKDDLFKVNDLSITFSIPTKKTNHVKIEGKVKKISGNSSLSNAKVHCSLNGNNFSSQFDYGENSNTYQETTTDTNGDFVIEFKGSLEPRLSTKREIFCMAKSSGPPYLDGGIGAGLPKIKAEIIKANATIPCYYWLSNITSDYDETRWENASFALGPKDGRYAKGNFSITFEFERVLPSGWIEFYVNGSAHVYIGETSSPSDDDFTINNFTIKNFSSNVKYIQLVPTPEIKIDAIIAHSLTHDLRVNQTARVNITVRAEPDYDLKHAVIGANFSGSSAEETLDTPEFQLDVSEQKTLSLEKEAYLFGPGILNIIPHIRDTNVDSDNDNSYGEFWADALDVCFPGESCYDSWYKIINSPPYGINLTWFGNKDGNKIIDRNKDAPQTADIMYFNITAKDLDAIYSDSEKLYITLRFRSDEGNTYGGNTVTNCVDKEMNLTNKSTGTFFARCWFNAPNSMSDGDLGYFDLEIIVRDNSSLKVISDFDTNNDLFKVEDIIIGDFEIINNTTFAYAEGEAKLISNNQPLFKISAQNCSYNGSIESCGIKPFSSDDCNLSGYNFSCFILDLKLLNKTTSLRYIITNEYNVSGYFDYNITLNGTINSINITDKDKWVNPLDNVWYVINFTNNGNLGWHGRLWNQTRIMVFSRASQNPTRELHVSLNYSDPTSWVNLPKNKTGNFSYFLGKSHWVLGLYNYTAELHYFWPYFNGSFYNQTPNKLNFSIAEGGFVSYRVAAIDLVDWKVPKIVMRTEPLEIKVKGYLVGDMDFDKWEKIQAFEFLASDNNSYAKFRVTKYNINTEEEDEEIPWENMSFNGLTNYWEALIDSSRLSCDNESTIHRVYMVINFTRYGIYKPYVKHKWRDIYNPYFYQEVTIDCGELIKELYLVKPGQANVPLGTKNKRVFIILIQNPGNESKVVNVSIEVGGYAKNWVWLGDVGEKNTQITLTIPRMQGDSYGANSTYVWIENAGRAGYYPVEIIIKDLSGNILFKKKTYINIIMHKMDEIDLYAYLALTLFGAILLTKRKLF